MSESLSAQRATGLEYLKDLVDTLAQRGRVMDTATALFIAEVVKQEIEALYHLTPVPRRRWTDDPTKSC